MTSNFEKIEILVQGSDLSEHDKEDFIGTLAGANNKELGELAVLFEDDKEWISILSKNYAQKKIAVMKEDAIMWHQIIEQERQLLAQKLGDGMAKDSSV